MSVSLFQYPLIADVAVVGGPAIRHEHRLLFARAARAGRFSGLRVQAVALAFHRHQPVEDRLLPAEPDHFKKEECACRQ